MTEKNKVLFSQIVYNLTEYLEYEPKKEFENKL